MNFKERNLLIVGAGEYGRLVKEVACDVELFNRIEFLDDKVNGVLGKISDMQKYQDEFHYAIIAMGDATLRKTIMEQLRSCGYEIVSLIHPKSNVSKSASIGDGCVVEPCAVVQPGSIVGEGCLICSGAVVGHDSIVGGYCHLNLGAIVPPKSNVKENVKINVGKVYEGEF